MPLVLRSNVDGPGGVREKIELTEGAAPNRYPALRGVYFGAGLLLVALGFVGVFLPILPTTPFLILALPCFARSSRPLERWLLAHPRLGPTLREWRQRGAISRRAKLMALAGVSTGFILFMLGSPGPLMTVVVVAAIFAGLLYVMSRPS